MEIHMLTRHLYYYRSSVRKNLSSQFDRFLAGRSNLDTNHGVNFSTPTSCQSATFVRPLFAFVLCCLRQKKSSKTTNATRVPALIQPVDPRPDGLLFCDPRVDDQLEIKLDESGVYRASTV